LIHDDLIATGGSALAATELVERLGAKVAGYSFIAELTALSGRDQLKKNIPRDILLAL
jgi:adenine phosphoribosyltransferase